MNRLPTALGRFGVAVLHTRLGGIAGLVIGLCRGITAADALPRRRRPWGPSRPLAAPSSS